MSDEMVKCGNCKHRESGASFMREDWGMCHKIIFDNIVSVNCGDEDIAVHDSFGCIMGEAKEE